MKPEIKEISSPGLVVLAVALLSGLSACSMLPASLSLNADAVDDNIKYRASDASIRALAIPPGLTVPAFDNAYAVSQRPVSAQNNNAQTPIQNTPGAAVATSNPNNAQVAAPTPKVRVAMMRLKGGEPALAVDSPFKDTWIRVAGILSNIGFEVQKQQPAEGIYTALYTGVVSQQSEAEGGMLSRLINRFGIRGVTTGEKVNRSSLDLAKDTYLILVAENASKQSFIGVADKDGKPVSEDVANKVLRAIKLEYER